VLAFPADSAETRSQQVLAIGSVRAAALVQLGGMRVEFRSFKLEARIEEHRLRERCNAAEHVDAMRTSAGSARSRQPVDSELTLRARSRSVARRLVDDLYAGGGAPVVLSWTPLESSCSSSIATSWPAPLSSGPSHLRTPAWSSTIAWHAVASIGAAKSLMVMSMFFYVDASSNCWLLRSAWQPKLRHR